MPEFKTELPKDVAVETATFIAFADGRPTEMVLASTEDEHVVHRKLSPLGDKYARQLLLTVYLYGLEPVDVDPAAD